MYSFGSTQITSAPSAVYLYFAGYIVMRSPLKPCHQEERRNGMPHKDWNPEQYLQFNRERLQPSIDLVSRIPITHPKTIIDVGCGPGNSTQILVNRWPESAVTGIDNSLAMIEHAQRDFPGQTWLLLDAGKDTLPGRWDLIFSNAVLQWIPDHPALFRTFGRALAPNGCIAVQIPFFFDMPIGKALLKIAHTFGEPTLADVAGLFTIHTPSVYYDMLSPDFGTVDMWVTDYLHLLQSHEAILDMVRGAGLRPYLDRIESPQRAADFENRVLEAIREAYPAQHDGRVLFPFKRFFMLLGNAKQASSTE